MTESLPVAFIDVETTGLDPAVNRIAEIGVVTVDGDDAAEWTTFIAQPNGQSRRPGSADGLVEPSEIATPCFKDIAVELEKRLAGRLLIAHNARFDYAFLKAEFQRVRVDFSRDVLCTVMLSRRLYPQHARHDLDSLMQRHDLRANVRHRALPDAQLLWQFWKATHRELPRAVIADAVSALLVGPVLPDHLDPALINRLPEAPGIYIFHDGDDELLHVGEARNLKLHLIDYFRLDRASTKSLSIAHRIRKITWRVTQGMLGARLQRVGVLDAMSSRKRARDKHRFLWRLIPDRYPILDLVPIAGASLSCGNEYFGMFQTERKARNALLRLARKHYLCHALLEIPDASGAPCLACCEGGKIHRCDAKVQRLKHLMKAFEALKPFRIATWPYPGPIGVRERSDVHIFDDWRYLGSARNETEIHEALKTRPRDFDKEVFGLLSEMLPKLPPRRILCLATTAKR